MHPAKSRPGPLACEAHNRIKEAAYRSKQNGALPPFRMTINPLISPENLCRENGRARGPEVECGRPTPMMRSSLTRPNEACTAATRPGDNRGAFEDVQINPRHVGADQARNQVRAAHLLLRSRRRAHWDAGGRGAWDRTAADAQDLNGGGRWQAGVCCSAVRSRTEHEEACGRVRRQGCEHVATCRCRTLERISCRRHQPVRAEKAGTGRDR